MQLADSSSMAAASNVSANADASRASSDSRSIAAASAVSSNGTSSGKVPAAELIARNSADSVSASVLAAVVSKRGANQALGDDATNSAQPASAKKLRTFGLPSALLNNDPLSTAATSSSTESSATAHTQAIQIASGHQNGAYLFYPEPLVDHRIIDNRLTLYSMFYCPPHPSHSVSTPSPLSSQPRTADAAKPPVSHGPRIDAALAASTHAVSLVPEALLDECNAWRRADHALIDAENAIEAAKQADNEAAALEHSTLVELQAMQCKLKAAVTAALLADAHQRCDQMKLAKAEANNDRPGPLVPLAGSSTLPPSSFAESAMVSAALHRQDAAFESFLTRAYRFLTLNPNVRHYPRLPFTEAHVALTVFDRVLFLISPKHFTIHRLIFWHSVALSAWPCWSTSTCARDMATIIFRCTNFRKTHKFV
jgi:hypothetical protein